MNTTATAQTTTVGRFTFNHETGKVVGPAGYLQSGRLEAIMDKIHSGQSTVYNTGRQLGHGGINLILVCIQTDYAAWAGEQEFLALSRR
ncbi:MAG: hypothetical protein Q8O14_12915 [bacterium]|nr:hypothetical protein [bacterium]